MSGTDYEVKTALSALYAVIRELSNSTKADRSELRVAEERVCLRSRVLYARYVDAALWRGVVDKPTYDAVHNALKEATECLSEDFVNANGECQPNRVRESVVGRLRDFEFFSARLLEIPVDTIEARTTPAP